MKTPKPHIRTRAFSLVEMLSVVAVIGIVSAIAVPNIGRINESARIAAAKRNAQSIASVCASAQAAGLDFVTDELTQSIANVVQGGTASEGVIAGAFFGVPALSEAERFAATRYLLLDGINSFIKRTLSTMSFLLEQRVRYQMMLVAVAEEVTYSSGRALM